jgi:hypothetical protein
MISTYSFDDVTLVISHPAVGVGRFVATSQGLGSISVSMTNDRTSHDVAADGSIMVSKILAKNGTISITVQQTSNLNHWLLKWYNYIESAPTNEWADAKLLVRAPLMGDRISCSGVSPQKIADRSYQAQGQNVTWSLMAAHISQENI